MKKILPSKLQLFKPAFVLAYLLAVTLQLPAQRVGIDILHPQNFVDVKSGLRTGNHISNRPLYITGNLGKDILGIEFRHLNGTQGIGFGYNTIYATGSNPNQNLSLYSKGKGRLSFYTKELERFQIDGNGHVIITSNMRGPDHLKRAYPLEIKGSNQGISITANGKAKNAHNYIGFFDLIGRPTGRIEGQTYLETLQSFDYIWNTIMYSLDIIIPTAEAIACGLNEIPDPAEIVTNTYAAAIASGDLIEYQIATLTNYGVSYASHGADYAEWIEKKYAKEQFSVGDIVGIKDGKVTLNTGNADHLMVISMAPVVLGNMPTGLNKNDFEKVAFLGQVWVKVIGDVAPGDFILASGLNNGKGYAVHPENLMGMDVNKVVGVAWTGTKGEKNFNLVKVGIGLHNRNLSNILEQRNRDNIQLESQLNSITVYLEKKDPKFKVALDEFLKTTTAPSTEKMKPYPKVKNTRQEKFLTIVKDHPDYLTVALKKIKAALLMHGYDFANHPETEKLLENENYFLKMYKENLLR